jgi:hypothetical protein
MVIKGCVILLRLIAPREQTLAYERADKQTSVPQSIIFCRSGRPHGRSSRATIICICCDMYQHPKILHVR